MAVLSLAEVGIKEKKRAEIFLFVFSSLVMFRLGKKSHHWNALIL